MRLLKSSIDVFFNCKAREIASVCLCVCIHTYVRIGTNKLIFIDFQIFLRPKDHALRILAMHNYLADTLLFHAKNKALPLNEQ